MATGEVEVMDDDRWLYGDGIDTGSNEPLDTATVNALLGEEEPARERTPDLDEIDATSGLGQLPVSKPLPTAPELQLKIKQDTEQADKESTEVTENGDDAITNGDQERAMATEAGTEEDLSDDEDDDDDDGVNITIGTIQNPALFGRAQFGRMPPVLGAGGAAEVAPVKKVDLDAVPQINGVPLPEVDIEESIVDKPWRKPGADVTDYFNYGFTEETWRLYCEKQRKMRHEANQINKLIVTSSMSHTMNTTPKVEMNKVFGFPTPTMDITPTAAMMSGNPIMPPPIPPPTASVINESQEENDSEGNEEKGTPPPDPGVLPPKLPILPPPGLPPTLPFPPQDVNAAAAMAAMFTGGPPPPIRPPDFPPAFPPPMHPAMPHFPPPMPGDIRPPFLPPGFNIGGEGPRGPLGMEDPRAAAGLFNPDMGFPPHWGDPSMGGHPEMVDFPPSSDYGGGRGSRSPSRSSSGSSRGSSVERHSSRRDKGRDKYESSRSRRSRRSRSHERSSHHRSSRRDHRDHRERDRDRDRDRERERDRDRRSDRHDKDRRERRRRDERRHERSSKRHRSRSDDDDDRDKKRSRSRSAS